MILPTEGNQPVDLEARADAAAFGFTSAGVNVIAGDGLGLGGRTETDFVLGGCVVTASSAIFGVFRFKYFSK